MNKNVSQVKGLENMAKQGQEMEGTRNDEKEQSIDNNNI